MFDIFWWVGGSGAAVGTVNPVSSESDNCIKHQQEVTEDRASAEPDQAEDEGDDVEENGDGDVAELDLPKESELGLDSRVDPEDVGQEEAALHEEGEPETKGEHSNESPTENVDDSSDKGQHHDGSTDHAIHGPQVAAFVD